MASSASSSGPGFAEVAAIPVDPATARVYEHGWQSWSPTAAYRLDERPHRPVSANRQVMSYRPGIFPPAEGFQGEGLLAVDPAGASPVVVVAAPPGADPVPSIRASLRGREVVVSADGPVEVHRAEPDADDLEGSLASWASGLAGRLGLRPVAAAPTVWCSWYHYFRDVTAADVAENVAGIAELALPIDVVQIDDGYQRDIGDWLEWSDRFGDLPKAVGGIRDAGHRAGIWVAPFLVGESSGLAAEHPEWLVPGVSAGHNWEQDLAVLDVTHPGAAEYLQRVFSSLHDLGVDYFKIDFLYAGAMPGPRHDGSVSPQQAYREGIALIREAIGPESYLVGCGAPILPSLGLFEAMRISPDVAPCYEPPDGDLCTPSQRAAALTGGWRAWQHGRWWVNDPDCLIARPEVERREDWLAQLLRYPGLASISDRLASLDGWGLAATRRLLERASGV